ncbi:MAG TPA: hypothetical protein VFQ38_11665 [Longimicrobiales bacterium]|nr:hypothetical protein [Longimicrobiales bacterium]
MRSLPIVLATLALAAPLAAQNPSSDPDKAAPGNGSLPAGWHARLDRPTAQLAQVKFVPMGSGYHFTSGPAAIYWRPTDNVTGTYTVQASFTQSAPSAHPEGYGVFVAGKELEAPNQSYVYFLVRQDGKFMVKHRAGAEVHTIVDWTENAAVKALPAGGKATNAFRVVAAADSVRAYINGTQVWAGERNYLGADGVAGLRVNHNLDVHVDGFSVTKGAAGKAAPKAKPAAKKSGR